jgi:hypothetical protein
MAVEQNQDGGRTKIKMAVCRTKIKMAVEQK